VWSARRRPRWGVRWRLDVANLFATDVRLDLTERAIYGQALFGGGTSGDMRSVSLPHIHVTKESMISRDARRERGIYLGEMVWALIFAALNKVAYLYPGRVVSNGTLAAVLGLKSAGAATGRRALEGIINTVGSTGLGAAPPTSSRRSRGFCPRVERCLVACRCPGHLDRREGECVLSVTLLADRAPERTSTVGRRNFDSAPSPRRDPRPRTIRVAAAAAATTRPRTIRVVVAAAARKGIALEASRGATRWIFRAARRRHEVPRS